MWKKLLVILSLFFSFSVQGQTLTTSFTDPCTKAITYFSIPVQGNTVIYFYGQQRTFTASDVASGAFASWTNQVYSDYRRLTPCSVQSVAVVRNQITSQVIGNVVSSVVGSINSSVMASASTGGGDGGSDAATKGNNSNGSNNSNTRNSTTNSNNGGSVSNGGSTSSGNQGNSSNPVGSGGESGGNNTGGGNTNGGSGSGNGNTTDTKTNDKGSEVVGTTTVNVDARNDKGSESSSSSNGGKGGKNGGKSSNSNPIIVSSDLTSAQNLNKSFTGIINVGMSRSSLIGTSSWGVTGMIWFNFKQFALNSRYTRMKINQKGTLKFVHNVNLTAAYSYGNVFSFLGYSMIINAKKWGITGFNVSGAVCKMPGDKNLFVSPSITGFYTKPFKYNKKFTISPEIYLISTPVVYSSYDKVTVTDRTFSMFLGSGFDYQISRRFKVNMNYKANISTNKDFPILSFFLIGSKVNL